MKEKVAKSNEMMALKDLLARNGQEIARCNLEDFGNLNLISSMQQAKAIFRKDKETGILYGVIEGEDANEKEVMAVLEVNEKNKEVVFYYGNELKTEYFGNGKIASEYVEGETKESKNLVINLMIDSNDLSQSYDEIKLNELVKRVSEKMIKTKEKKNTPPEMEMLKALKEIVDKEAHGLINLDIEDADSFCWLHTIEKPKAVFRFDEDTGTLYGVIEGLDENEEKEIVVLEADIYQPTFGIDGLYNAKFFFESNSDAIGTKYIEYGQLSLSNAKGEDIGIGNEGKIDYKNTKIELLVNEIDILIGGECKGYTSKSFDLVYSVFKNMNK